MSFLLLYLRALRVSASPREIHGFVAARDVS
jgi:hypothetical protein